MKKTILLLLFSLSFIHFGIAQNTQFNEKGIAQVKESARTMSPGQVTAYTIILQNTSKKQAEKEWPKYMKQFKAKTKKQKKTEEHFTDNAKIQSMSKNTVDVYTTINQVSDTDTELTVCFDLGGAFLSTEMHSEKISAANEVLTGFAMNIAKSHAEDALEIEKKSLKGLTGDLKDLQKDKEKLEKSIEEFEKKIEEAKQDIAKNLEKQELKSTEIEAQEKVVDRAKLKVKSYDN